MSRHLERLLKIDNLLRSSNLQTSDTLADALEVTERTIRSDLAFLRDRAIFLDILDRVRPFYKKID